MRTIASGEQKVIKLLGKQPVQDTEYRMMRYVLNAECEEGKLLHNVITGQLVLLSSEESKALDRLPAERCAAMTELIENSFLVPVGYDEKDTVQKLRIMMKRLFAPKGINSYLILTTTNCNARCPYCFEHGIRLMNMTPRTAERVVEYIAAHKSKQEVKLHWFGGEPLVGVDGIDQICEGLKAKKIAYESVMTSNGYLFTEEIVKRAVTDWRLKRVQITLDGTEPVYNRVKGFVSDKSPFRVVMENIGTLLKADIRVILRLNLDADNGDDLRSLIDELNGLFPEKGNLRIYVSAIQDSRPMEERRKLDLSAIGLNDYISRLGLSERERKLLSLRTNSCMADSDEAVVVLPDGRLEKCENICDEDVFGHIDAQAVNEKAEAFKETFEYPYCGDCPIYPSCILLKRCPTKQREQPEMCQRSIREFREDLVAHYLTAAEKKKL